jgi:hypothetical protein
VLWLRDDHFCCAFFKGYTEYNPVSLRHTGLGLAGNIISTTRVREMSHLCCLWGSSLIDSRKFLCPKSPTNACHGERISQLAQSLSEKALWTPVTLLWSRNEIQLLLVICHFRWIYISACSSEIIVTLSLNRRKERMYTDSITVRSSSGCCGQMDRIPRQGPSNDKLPVVKFVPSGLWSWYCSIQIKMKPSKCSSLKLL